MNRSQLEHILRAASAITRQGRFVVGSQSIVAVLPDPPGVLGYSAEADIYPLDAPELADLIDGSIGEGSPFHETFGYYAQGVGPDTAVLPDGWQYRLNQVRDPVTLADGFCIDPLDLAASKTVAWREKDRDFLAAMLQRGLINTPDLQKRVAQIPQPRLDPYGLNHDLLAQRVGMIGLTPATEPAHPVARETSTIDGMRRAVRRRGQDHSR